MATFDQALTESALIVIPLLIFLLGIGWAFGGGSGGGKVVEDENRNAADKRQKETENLGNDMKQKEADPVAGQKRKAEEAERKVAGDAARNSDDAGEKENDEAKRGEEAKQNAEGKKDGECDENGDVAGDGGGNGTGDGGKSGNEGPGKTSTLIRLPDSADGTPLFASIATPNTPGIGHNVDINIYDPNNPMISNAPSGLAEPTPPPPTAPANGNNPFGRSTPPSSGVGTGLGHPRGPPGPPGPPPPGGGNFGPGLAGYRGTGGRRTSPPPVIPPQTADDEPLNGRGGPVPSVNRTRGLAKVMPPMSAMPMGRGMSPLDGDARAKVDPTGVPAGITRAGMPRGILKVPGETPAFQLKKPEGLTINNVNVMPRPATIQVPVPVQPFNNTPLHLDLAIDGRAPASVSELGVDPKPITFFPEVHVTQSPEPVSAIDGAVRQATFAPGENGIWAPLKVARPKTVRPDPIAVAEKEMNATYDPITGQYIAKPAPVAINDTAKTQVDHLDDLLKDIVSPAEPTKQPISRDTTSVKTGGLAMDYWLENIPSPDEAAKAKLLGTSPTKARPESIEAKTLDLIKPEPAAKVKPSDPTPAKARPVIIEDWIQRVVSPDAVAKQRISLVGQAISPVSAKPEAVELPDGQTVIQGKALRVGKDGKVRQVEFAEGQQLQDETKLGSKPERKVRQAVEPLGKVKPETEPNLIRVVDDKGNVIGVAKAPAQPPKVSPEGEPAKARAQVEEANATADPPTATTTAEEEIKQELELIKLRQEVKAFDARCEREEAVPGRATATAESEQNDLLSEMRKKLSDLKTARRNEAWELAKADIDKASARIDERRVARGEENTEPKAAEVEGHSTTEHAPSSRKDVEVPPARVEPGMRDTGLRRRKSVLVRTDSGDVLPTAREEAESDYADLPPSDPGSKQARKAERETARADRVNDRRSERTIDAKTREESMDLLPPPRRLANETYEEPSQTGGESDVDKPVLRPPPSRLGRSVRPAAAANARLNQEYSDFDGRDNSSSEVGEKQTPHSESLASDRDAFIGRPAQVDEMSSIGKKSKAKLRLEKTFESSSEDLADTRARAEAEDDGIETRTVGPESSISQKPSIPPSAAVLHERKDMVRSIHLDESISHAAPVKNAKASPDGIKSAEIQPNSSVSNHFERETKSTKADIEVEDDGIVDKTIVAGDSVSQVGHPRRAPDNKADRSGRFDSDAIDQTAKQQGRPVDLNFPASVEEDDSGSNVPGDSVSQGPSELDSQAARWGRSGRKTIVTGLEERIGHKNPGNQDSPAQDVEEGDRQGSIVDRVSAAPGSYSTSAAKQKQGMMPAQMQHVGKSSARHESSFDSQDPDSLTASEGFPADDHSAQPQTLARPDRSATETDEQPDQVDFRDKLEEVDIWRDKISGLHSRIDVDLATVSKGVEAQQKWLDGQQVEAEKLFDQISNFPENEQSECRKLARSLGAVFGRHFTAIEKVRQEGSEAPSGSIADADLEGHETEGKGDSSTAERPPVQGRKSAPKHGGKMLPEGPGDRQKHDYPPPPSAQTNDDRALSPPLPDLYDSPLPKLSPKQAASSRQPDQARHLGQKPSRADYNSSDRPGLSGKASPDNDLDDLQEPILSGTVDSEVDIVPSGARQHRRAFPGSSAKITAPSIVHKPSLQHSMNSLGDDGSDGYVQDRLDLPGQIQAGSLNAQRNPMVFAVSDVPSGPDPQELLRTGVGGRNAKQAGESQPHPMKAWRQLFLERSNIYTHIMNDQHPLDRTLRDMLDETIKWEERDRETRSNNENVKRTDKAFLDDVKAKKAYEIITDTWTSFRAYDQAPLIKHPDDWKLRIARTKVLYDAVQQLDMGFFTRRLEDREELRRIEAAVGRQQQPDEPLTKRYEAITQNWWYHAAFVCHFGRKSVIYPMNKKGVRGNEPKYKPLYEATRAWLNSADGDTTQDAKDRGKAALDKCRALAATRKSHAVAGALAKSKEPGSSVVQVGIEKGFQDDQAPLPQSMQHTQKSRRSFEALHSGSFGNAPDLGAGSPTRDGEDRADMQDRRPYGEGSPRRRDSDLYESDAHGSAPGSEYNEGRGDQPGAPDNISENKVGANALHQRRQPFHDAPNDGSPSIDRTDQNEADWAAFGTNKTKRKQRSLGEDSDYESAEFGREKKEGSPRPMPKDAKHLQRGQEETKEIRGEKTDKSSILMYKHSKTEEWILGDNEGEQRVNYECVSSRRGRQDDSELGDQGSRLNDASDSETGDGEKRLPEASREEQIRDAWGLAIQDRKDAMWVEWSARHNVDGHSNQQFQVKIGQLEKQWRRDIGNYVNMEADQGSQERKAFISRTSKIKADARWVSGDATSNPPPQAGQSVSETNKMRGETAGSKRNPTGERPSKEREQFSSNQRLGGRRIEGQTGGDEEMINSRAPPSEDNREGGGRDSHDPLDRSRNPRGEDSRSGRNSQGSLDIGMGNARKRSPKDRGDGVDHPLASADIASESDGGQGADQDLKHGLQRRQGSLDPNAPKWDDGREFTPGMYARNQRRDSDTTIGHDNDDLTGQEKPTLPRGERVDTGPGQPGQAAHNGSKPPRHLTSLPGATKSSNPSGKSGFFSSFIHHIRTSKILTLILILYTVVFIMGARQITVLVTLPPRSTGGSNLAKRGTSDLPPDLALTQDWLISILGGTVDPGMAMAFLFIWIGLGIMMFGILYNAILEGVSLPPKELSEEEMQARQGKWYRGGPKKIFKAVWRKAKSIIVGTAKVILMDRHPSIGRLWKLSGWWTLLRISIFFAQLSSAVVILRQTIALASLVAGAADPTPAGFDIDSSRSWLDTTSRMMSTEGTMLLLLSVIGASIMIVTVGWYSLLHPRQRDPNASAMTTIGRIFTFKISSGTYRVLEGLVGITLIMTFGFCVVYFAEIIAYTSSISFMQDNDTLVKSIGLVGASLIFGLFALPLAWVYLKVEKLVLSVFKRRSGRRRQTASVRD